MVTSNMDYSSIHMGRLSINSSEAGYNQLINRISGLRQGENSKMAKKSLFGIRNSIHQPLEEEKSQYSLARDNSQGCAVPSATSGIAVHVIHRRDNSHKHLLRQNSKSPLFRKGAPQPPPIQV
jgi:hypothetical protein